MPSISTAWEARCPSHVDRRGYAAELNVSTQDNNGGGAPAVIAGPAGIDYATGRALLLHDSSLLAAVDHSERDALQRWAWKLWGITVGELDIAAGLVLTRAWFTTQRAAMLVARLHADDRQ